MMSLSESCAILLFGYIYVQFCLVPQLNQFFTLFLQIQTEPERSFCEHPHGPGGEYAWHH